ncbi:MAG TPA: ATP-binding protein [Candidatus Acidoferrales bacterium]|nr:ATP-binding protein [Candidatus Acidoferrales bacterium]
MKWNFESEDAGSAYGARRGLLDYLRLHATVDSDIDAAALIFGELVGNVVRHAPGPISIDVYWQRGLAVLRVTDRGPGFAWTGGVALPDAMAESGRGLYIAFAAARRLQVAGAPGKGTVVTAWLPVRLHQRFRP